MLPTSPSPDSPITLSALPLAGTTPAAGGHPVAVPDPLPLQPAGPPPGRRAAALPGQTSCHPAQADDDLTLTPPLPSPSAVRDEFLRVVPHESAAVRALAAAAGGLALAVPGAQRAVGGDTLLQATLLLLTGFSFIRFRTWMSVRGEPATRSLLPRHPNSTSRLRSDPNDEFSFDAVLEWISLADFYVWPHIIQVFFSLLLALSASFPFKKTFLPVFFFQFSSFEDLCSKLAEKLSLPASDPESLSAISGRMHEFNVQEERRIRLQWLLILSKIRAHRKERHGKKSHLPVDINEALAHSYGYRLSDSSCVGQINVET